MSLSHYDSLDQAFLTHIRIILCSKRLSDLIHCHHILRISLKKGIDDFNMYRDFHY